MKKIIPLTIFVPSLLIINQASVAADSLAEAFSEGKANLSMRYRYEFVEQDSFDRDANASTLRTRFNFKTDAYKGFSFFTEFDNVSRVFSDNYNSGAGTSPNRTRFPVVADPTGTELNQVWINYHFSDHDLKIGRQRIVLDDQRFIGGVAWRQNEQTYDAASFNFNLGSSKLFASYVDQVNRIFGNDVPAGSHDNKTFLVNWSSQWSDRHKWVGYYYGIDNDNVASFSTNTLGFTYDTFWQLEDSKVSLALDFARQTDAANNPVDYTANYWKVEGKFSNDQTHFTVGREVLGGDANRSGAAFRTPLATLHAFNGWADLFLGTPASGLEDTYLGINGAYHQFKWYIRYHDFKSESTSQDFGSEVNAFVSMKVNKKLSLLLRYAQYESDGFGPDTKKMWFMMTYNF